MVVAAVHEAHPLSSPGLVSPAPSESGAHSGGATLNVNGNPKYVPYTPRQRVTPTSATTATAYPPALPQHQGDATSKLQLMHLKAAAQGIGLDSGTLGWSILEKLVLDCDYSDEWMEIYNVISSSKVYIFLWSSSLIQYSLRKGDVITSLRTSLGSRQDHGRVCERPYCTM